MIELRIDKQMTDALLDGTVNPRWTQIQQVVEFIVGKTKKNSPANLVFVCTHNSRRSQFAHVWAEAFARTFHLHSVQCSSAGTEVTECNLRTIDALRRFGFEVVSEGENNPDFSVKYSEKYPPVICYSSLLSSTDVRDFAAIMCCSEADEHCPTDDRAAIRLPFHYDDPKQADDTPEESAKYDDCCRQIGADMMLIMSTAANRLDTA